MDRAGIVIAIAVVVSALGFLATGGIGSLSDIPPTLEKTTEPIKEASIKTTEKIKEISESGSQVMKEVSEKTRDVVEETKEMGKTVKELSTSKLPSRLVSIPHGTAVPGCEESDKCYDPPSLIIFKGGEIIWRNDDSSTHTVTSGDIINGHDDEFDSGLIMAGETYSHQFEESGEYPYFCMIHPWANASITVK